MPRRSSGRHEGSQQPDTEKDATLGHFRERKQGPEVTALSCSLVGTLKV